MIIDSIIDNDEEKIIYIKRGKTDLKKYILYLFLGFTIFINVMIYISFVNINKDNYNSIEANVNSASNRRIGTEIHKTNLLINKDLKSQDVE